VALVLLLIIKKPEAPAAPGEDVKLLAEIRDLLKAT